MGEVQTKKGIMHKIINKLLYVICFQGIMLILISLLNQISVSYNPVQIKREANGSINVDQIIFDLGQMPTSDSFTHSSSIFILLMNESLINREESGYIKNYDTFADLNKEDIQKITK